MINCASGRIQSGVTITKRGKNGYFPKRLENWLPTGQERKLQKTVADYFAMLCLLNSHGVPYNKAQLFTGARFDLKRLSGRSEQVPVEFQTVRNIQCGG